MPVWHDGAKNWVESGKLVIVGITQEQHPQRCRLFTQWKKLGFPIAHDPFTILGTAAVPLVIAIDEHGIVRSTRPRLATFEREFLDKKFKNDAPSNAPASPTPLLVQKTGKPDIERLTKTAIKSDRAADWRHLGDAHYLWGGDSRLGDAIDAYVKALKREPKDGAILFRLGVCYRRRFEMDEKHSADFQRAVDFWGQALATNPNQYIWRRRIQQYGPRLDKPYPFYDWVEQARKDIVARGEKPLELQVPLVGAEIARPIRRFSTNPTITKNPDPEGRINRDKTLVRAEVTVVPAKLLAGKSARIHVAFYPNVKKKAHWNNEGEPLRLWIDAPKGWQVSQQLLMAPQPKKPPTRELRTVDFEIQAPRDAKSGKYRLKAYVLYNVCEDVDGTCLFLRQDVAIIIDVAR